MDLPYTTHVAIVNALHYLGFEELPKDERPKRNIWQDGERLKEHFAEVERRRKAESNPTDAIADRPIEDPVQNSAARDLLGI